MRTRLALVSALTVLATVTSAHAAGKTSHSGKSTKNATVHSNPLKVSPTLVKAGGMLHISGTKFGASKKIEIQIGCPLWDAKHKAVASLSPRTNKAGSFSISWKAVAPKKGSMCNVYALNMGGKIPAWDTVGVTVKK